MLVLILTGMLRAQDRHSYIYGERQTHCTLHASVATALARPVGGRAIRCVPSRRWYAEGGLQRNRLSVDHQEGAPNFELM